MPDFPRSGIVAIRVCADSVYGMGHIVRCANLAREFFNRGVNIRFIVDHYSENLKPWIGEFEVFSLYDKFAFVDQLQDATLCQPYINDDDWLIVDDYRLSIIWERQFKSRVARLLVIDDLANRAHDCDALVDYRWCKGVRDNTRYLNLVPEYCKRLLGPDFCLLGSEYRNATSQRKLNTPFVVMLSLGGGGDLSILSNLLAKLCSESWPFEIEFRVVVGALSKNQDSLKRLAMKYDCMSIVRGSTSLATLYEEADLFIGAAGTSIYELNWSNLPSITFAQAENQNNEMTDLEDLGLFMHLKKDELLDIGRIKELILCLRENYPRALQLSASARIKVDGLGTCRVVDEMMGTAVCQESHLSMVNEISPLSSSGYTINLPGGLTIRNTVDRDINHYLNARNREANRIRMSVERIVSKSEHYSWWFSNARDSYVLRNGEKPLLYIWHQREFVKGREYLIGGWIIAADDCGFDVTALALNWQLQYCRDKYPQATWLAIISRENKFVNLLNKLNGFLTAEEGGEEARAIEALFPFADKQKFNYLICLPDKYRQEVAV